MDAPPRALPPLSSRPTVSVVIPARDSARTLGDAVDSALAQGAIVDEVVIAVGPSTDGTLEAARALEADERVRVVDNPSGRTPSALNAAIGASTGEVIVRLDAHAVLPTGYVERAVATLRESGAANVGGRQVPTAEGGFARAVALAMGSPLGSGGAAYRHEGPPGEVETVYLGVFRRAALDGVGGFDERFVRNQDYELNERLRRHGYTVWFDPELEVGYRPRSTVTALARQYLEYGRWRRRTARTHPGSLRLRHRAAPAIVLTLAAGVLAGVVTGLWWVPALVIGGYLVLLVAAGAYVGGPRSAAAVALALAVMHLSWGVGFLRGPAPLTTPGHPHG